MLRVTESMDEQSLETDMQTRMVYFIKRNRNVSGIDTIAVIIMRA